MALGLGRPGWGRMRAQFPGSLRVRRAFRALLRAGPEEHPADAKKECWREWLHGYTYGQSRDRVEYARRVSASCRSTRRLPQEEARGAARAGRCARSWHRSTNALWHRPNIIRPPRCRAPSVSEVAAVQLPPQAIAMHAPAPHAPKGAVSVGPRATPRVATPHATCATAPTARACPIASAASRARRARRRAPDRSAVPFGDTFAIPPSGIVTVQEYGSSSRRRARSVSTKITALLLPRC